LFARDRSLELDLAIDDDRWHCSHTVRFRLSALVLAFAASLDNLATARLDRLSYQSQGFATERTTSRENFDPPCRRRHDAFFSFFGTQQHLSKVLPVSLQYDLPSFISQQQVLTSFFAAVQNRFWSVSAPNAAAANRDVNINVRSDFIQTL
jgi:hypothetical protein